MKQRVRVRLASLPQYLDAAQHGELPTIGSIRCPHGERLLTVRPRSCLHSSRQVQWRTEIHEHAARQVAGTVVRAGAVQVLEAQRIYECSRCQLRRAPVSAEVGCLCPPLRLLTTRCGRFRVEADLEMRATLPVPQACPNQGGCHGTSFLHIESMRTLTDYQEVRAASQAYCTGLRQRMRGFKHTVCK